MLPFIGAGGVPERRGGVEVVAAAVAARGRGRVHEEGERGGVRRLGAPLRSSGSSGNGGGVGAVACGEEGEEGEAARAHAAVRGEGLAGGAARGREREVRGGLVWAGKGEGLGCTVDFRPKGS